MIEAVSNSTIKASDLRVASVQRPMAPAPVAETASAAKPATAPVAAPGSLASSMAAEPPVDASRVQEIKTALANGTFPLSPSTIADQFIALKLDWVTSNEQA